MQGFEDAYKWLRDYVTAIKAGQLHPFTAVERKAREATRREPWGPTGTQLAELAELSAHPQPAQIIFAVLEYRLTREPDKWRNVYKALQVLEYLLRRGSEYCPQLAAAGQLPPLVDALTRFEGFDTDGRDVGQNVRIRSQSVSALLRDPARLQQARKDAAAREVTYLGYSRSQLPPAGPGLSGGGYGQAAGFGFQQPGYGDGGGAADVWGRRELPGGSFSGGSGHGARGLATAASMDAMLRAEGATRTSSRGLPAANGLGGGSGSLAAAAPPPPHQQQQQPARGFGEAKGISFEDNQRHLAQLRVLLGRPGNRLCADCQEPGPAARPSWASVNTGAFICLRCAGLHRGLGVHVSKVRSCSLDTWLPEQVALMEATGNAAANAHFEARLPPGERPARDSPDMAAFVLRKYAECAWAAEGPWPPPLGSGGGGGAAASAPPAAAAARAQPAASQPPQLAQLSVEEQLAQRQAAAAAAAAAAAGSAQGPAGAVPAPAAPAAAFSAQRQLPGPAAAAAPAVASGSAGLAASEGELISLEDAGPAAFDPFSTLATDGGANVRSLWDVLDQDPSLDILDWLDKSIASGADAAAQRASVLRHAATQQRAASRDLGGGGADFIATYEFNAFSSDDEVDWSTFDPPAAAAARPASESRPAAAAAAGARPCGAAQMGAGSGSGGSTASSSAPASAAAGRQVAAPTAAAARPAPGGGATQQQRQGGSAGPAPRGAPYMHAPHMMHPGGVPAFAYAGMPQGAPMLPHQSAAVLGAYAGQGAAARGLYGPAPIGYAAVYAGPTGGMLMRPMPPAPNPFGAAGPWPAPGPQQAPPQARPRQQQ